MTSDACTHGVVMASLGSALNAESADGDGREIKVCLRPWRRHLSSTLYVPFRVRMVPHHTPEERWRDLNLRARDFSLFWHDPQNKTFDLKVLFGNLGTHQRPHADLKGVAGRRRVATTARIATERE